jgi:hypothetical protein
MTWKQEKLLEQLNVVKLMGDLVVVSGGLAWHLMSPPHVENKTVHDHSDIDLFAIPNRSQETFQKLKELGFNRYWTKYTTKNFYRYGKTATRDNKRVKVLIDLFIDEVPFIRIGEYQVIDPKHLLPLYESTHSSKNCTAVVNATKLMKKGIDPVNRPELIGEKPTKRFPQY